MATQNLSQLVHECPSKAAALFHGDFLCAWLVSDSFGDLADDFGMYLMGGYL